jgi:hypothetical protein
MSLYLIIVLLVALATLRRWRFLVKPRSKTARHRTPNQELERECRRLERGGKRRKYRPQHW